MNTIRRRISQISTACCLLGVLTATSVAEEPTWFGEKASGDWFVGLRAGSVQSGETGFGDATNAGVLFGYQFDRPVGLDGTASVEFEFTTTTSDGNVQGTSAQFGRQGKWDVDTLAVYFAYRTPGTVYFKGKAGLLQSDISVSIPGSPFSNDDTSVAFGAGLGVRLMENKANIEFEYTGSTGDNDIGMVTLGGNLLF